MKYITSILSLSGQLNQLLENRKVATLEILLYLCFFSCFYTFSLLFLIPSPCCLKNRACFPLCMESHE